MRRLRYTLEPQDAGRTVKSIALRELRLSRGQFSSLKFRDGLRVAGRPVRADERLSAGDTLEALLCDTAEPIRPYEAPLKIAYADEDYFILDKPAPLPTLSSAHQEGPTLENALYAHLGCPENYVFRPVNRLDKGTSGLLAAARNAHAQQLLQRQLHTPEFIREYQALCLGAPPREAGRIDLPIARAGEGGRRGVSPDGKPAVTHYRLEAQGAGLSLLRLRLETGRTHQIRVHLTALGCPILGDYLYGAADPALPGRFALHACLLSFRHPLTGRIVACESPLPAPLAARLDGLTIPGEAPIINKL